LISLAASPVKSLAIPQYRFPLLALDNAIPVPTLKEILTSFYYQYVMEFNLSSKRCAEMRIGGYAAAKRRTAGGH